MQVAVEQAVQKAMDLSEAEGLFVRHRQVPRIVAAWPGTHDPRRRRNRSRRRCAMRSGRGPSRFFSGRQSAYRDSFVASTLSREMRGAVRIGTAFTGGGK